LADRLSREALVKLDKLKSLEYQVIVSGTPGHRITSGKRKAIVRCGATSGTFSIPSFDLNQKAYLGDTSSFFKIPLAANTVDSICPLTKIEVRTSDCLEHFDSKQINDPTLILNERFLENSKDYTKIVPMDFETAKRYNFCVIFISNGGNFMLIKDISLTIACSPDVEIIAEEKLVTKAEIPIISSSKFVTYTIPKYKTNLNKSCPIESYEITTAVDGLKIIECTEKPCRDV
jgi:hypothetical protein